MCIRCQNPQYNKCPLLEYIANNQDALITTWTVGNYIRVTGVVKCSVTPIISMMITSVSQIKEYSMD